MFPPSHPVQIGATTVTGPGTKTTWSGSPARVGDGRLERWLLDQLLLAKMDLDQQLAMVADLCGVLGRVRQAAAGGLDLEQVCAKSTPEEPGWRWFEVNGTFQIWRTGKQGFVLDLRPSGSGELCWSAGHNFQPTAACSACKKNNAAKALEPRCLTHVTPAFRQRLQDEGVVAGPDDP